MEPWLEDAISGILANTNVIHVPSVGSHVRFYTESLEAEHWDRIHHLIDLEHSGSFAAKLTITQLSLEGASQVMLSYNEVDDLLTVLLQWRCEEVRRQMAEADAAEPLTRESDDSRY